MGILGHRVNRCRDNPNRVDLYFAVGDVDKTRAFMSSPELQAAMAEPGVKGPPDVRWMKPVSQNAIMDRQLSAMIITHRVWDFSAWSTGYWTYHAADGVRRANGIIGHAVNQAMDDPNLVVVYSQVETHDALQAFLAKPELKAAMERAGVTGSPTVTFHTGGWGKVYG